MKKSKNGLAMVTLFILLYAAAIAAIIVGSIMVEQAETKAGWIVLIVAGGVYAAIGWIFFIGLKVLKPQEALVLTLFGKYVGTIKEAGFYFVNPFCVAVNPAASTKLNQSGDVMEISLIWLAWQVLQEWQLQQEIIHSQLIRRFHLR